MAISDVIEREIVYEATRSEVWAALTTAEGLGGWWAERTEIDARPGGTMVFHFGREHGTSEAQIDVFEPEERFAYFWRPFDALAEASEYPDIRTRVEFVLEDHPKGTLLKLRESGFAALPEVLAGDTLRENTHGWDIDVLPRLRTFVETGERVPYS